MKTRNLLYFSLGEDRVTHCLRRAWERYDIALYKSSLRELEKKIEDGDCVWVKKLSTSRSLCIVNHDGTAMIAMWHRRKKHILTFYK